MRVLDSVRQIAGRFNIASSQGVDNDLKRILEAPFKESLKYIITVPRRRGREGARRGGEEILRAPDGGTEEVSVQSDLRRRSQRRRSDPGDFRDRRAALSPRCSRPLSKLVVKQGKQWAANPAVKDVKPSAELIAFMNKMQGIQGLVRRGLGAIEDALFAQTVADQNVEGIRSTSTATIDIVQGQRAGEQLTGRAPAGRGDGAGGWQYSLRRVFGHLGGAALDVRSDPRPAGRQVAQWSMLRQGHGQGQQATDAQGQPIVLRVEITEFPAGVDLFDRNLFNIHCPSKVAE